MQRWEPPRATGPRTKQRDRNETVHAKQRQVWSEGIRIAAIRAAVGLSFIIPATATAPRTWMIVSGSGAFLALVALSVFPTSWGTSSSRVSWAADAVTLGLLTPLLAFNLFAGTGDGPLLPAEQSVYVQAFFMSVAILIGLAIMDVWTGASFLKRWGVTLMPAALTVPALAGVYEEVRGITVAAALATTWIVAALATALTHLLPVRIGATIPFLVFSLFTVVNIVARPGVMTLGGEDDLVSLFHPLLIFFAGACLLVGPLFEAMRSTEQRRGPDEPRRRRNPQAR